MTGDMAEDMLRYREEKARHGFAMPGQDLHPSRGRTSVQEIISSMNP
jgi:hypothetical protein